MFTIVSATFTSFFVIIDNKLTFILFPQYAYYTFIKRSFSILKKTLEVIDKSHAITILRYWKAWYGGSMSKISIYHSSIKVKSKNIKSNVVKDYICCLPELQIISCRRQLKKIHGTHGPHGFYLKIIISGQRPYFNKDFPKRFLALAQPKNIHLRSDDHTKRRGGIHIQPLQPKKILI